jgi:hypothetical protein
VLLKEETYKKQTWISIVQNLSFIGYCSGVVCPSVCTNFVTALFLCNFWLEFNKTLWEISIPWVVHIVDFFEWDPSRQSYGPWLVMLILYAYRAITVSEFNKTLWEPSRRDVYIVAFFFLLGPSTKSYGPWLVMYSREQ